MILPSKQRYGYIDAMRGFSMFLVVLGHVASLSMGVDDALTHFFTSFRMPLFFFISGFIGFKPVSKWVLPFFVERCKLKFFVQIIPALIFCTIYLLAYKYNIYDFITNSYNGYWFTFCLLEMFLVYFCLSVIAAKVNENILVPSLITISILGIMYIIQFRRSGFFIGMFNVDNFAKYFQFFVTGLIFSKYKDCVKNLISRDSVKTFLISAFVLSFLFVEFEYLSGFIYKIFHDIILRYLGLFAVYSIFYSAKDVFDTEYKIVKVLKFVGRRTLDVYLLHYFFLPDLGDITNVFYSIPGNKVVLEIALLFVLTLLVLFACIASSWCIRQSKILAYWCFGAKSL